VTSGSGLGGGVSPLNAILVASVTQRTKCWYSDGGDLNGALQVFEFWFAPPPATSVAALMV